MSQAENKVRWCLNKAKIEVEEGTKHRGLIEYLKEQKKINLSDEIIEALKSVEKEEKEQKKAIELREDFQYGTETKIEDKTLSELKGLCQKAIEETKKIIYKET